MTVVRCFALAVALLGSALARKAVHMTTPSPHGRDYSNMLGKRSTPESTKRLEDDQGAGDLNNLTVKVLKGRLKKLKEPVSGLSNDKLVERLELQCAICYKSLAESQEGFVKRLCRHPGDTTVHRSCFDRWMAKAFRCPICNRQLSEFTQQEWADAGDKRGHQTDAFGDGVYTGSWKGGRPNGQGRYTSAEAWVYEGAWKYGKRSGQGKYTFADDGVYEGAWKNDERSGQGKMTFASGSVYEGAWKNDEMSGQGKYTFADDGGVYEGSWEGDMPNGQGKRTYSSGSVYEGAWKNDERSGQGKMIFASGSVYEGAFEGDRPNGQGKMTFADGSVYEGAWEDGKKSGQGKMTFADGSVYEGPWEGDIPTGRGR